MNMQLSGDFYRDEDVTRGVSLMNPGVMPELMGMGSMDLDDHDKLLAGHHVPSPFFHHSQCDTFKAMPDFEDEPAEDLLAVYEGAEKPPVWTPDDLSPLTIPLLNRDFTGAQAAASMHWFFLKEKAVMEEPASDSDDEDECISDAKPRLGKLAMKATVFQQISGYDLYCTVKVQVVLVRQADRPDPVLTVDFARRSGDALAFGEVFKRAREYMKAVNPTQLQVPSHLATGGAPVLARSQPPVLDVQELPGKAHEAALRPLVQMLEDSSSPALQAEAAGALLAAATASAAGTVAVCAVLANFKDLLDELLESDTRIAVPVNRLKNLTEKAGAAKAKSSWKSSVAWEVKETPQPSNCMSKKMEEMSNVRGLHAISAGR